MSPTGPFGLYMGMQLNELTDPQEIGPHKYRLQMVPKPHSAFDFYVVQVTPRHGLSWIKAIGKDVHTSPHGYDLLAAFEALEHRLGAVYGHFERHDYLLPGSIWNEPQDWMAAIEAQERRLWSQWSAELGSRLKDSLSSVALLANANDVSTGWLTVEYAFLNESDASLEVQQVEDEAL